MKKISDKIFLLILPLLGACSYIQSLDKNGNFTVSAADLDTTKIDIALSQSDPDAAQAAIEVVAMDSEKKCNQFLSALILNETGSNTILDIGTTIASAGATAISAPTSAIHALTALATVSSGTKTAINADFFAKASVSNYAQAIQATYFSQIGSYISSLEMSPHPTSDRVKSWSAGEVAKIQGFHVLCGLGPAQSSVTATLANAATAKVSSYSSVTWVFTASSGGKATGNVSLRIDATSTLITPQTAIVIIKKDEKINDIISDLILQVYNQITKINPSLTAAIGGNSNSIVFTSNTSDAVTWALSDISSAGITLAIAPLNPPTAANSDSQVSGPVVNTPTALVGASEQAIKQ